MRRNLFILVALLFICPSAHAQSTPTWSWNNPPVASACAAPYGIATSSVNCYPFGQYVGCNGQGISGDGTLTATSGAYPCGLPNGSATTTPPTALVEITGTHSPLPPAGATPYRRNWNHGVYIPVAGLVLFKQGGPNCCSATINNSFSWYNDNNSPSIGGSGSAWQLAWTSTLLANSDEPFYVNGCKNYPYTTPTVFSATFCQITISTNGGTQQFWDLVPTIDGHNFTANAVDPCTNPPYTLTTPTGANCNVTPMGFVLWGACGSSPCPTIGGGPATCATAMASGSACFGNSYHVGNVYWTAQYVQLCVVNTSYPINTSYTAHPAYEPNCLIPGSGGPTVTITGSGGGSGAVVSATGAQSAPISNLTIIAGGTSYSGTISCSISGGGGTGATCTATQSGGAINSVTLTAGGGSYSQYMYNPSSGTYQVSFIDTSPANGTGATLTGTTTGTVCTSTTTTTETCWGGPTESPYIEEPHHPYHLWTYDGTDSVVLSAYGAAEGTGFGGTTGNEPYCSDCATPNLTMFKFSGTGNLQMDPTVVCSELSQVDALTPTTGPNAYPPNGIQPCTDASAYGTSPPLSATTPPYFGTDYPAPDVETAAVWDDCNQQFITLGGDGDIQSAFTFNGLTNGTPKLWREQLNAWNNWPSNSPATTGHTRVGGVWISGQCSVYMLYGGSNATIRVNQIFKGTPASGTWIASHSYSKGAEVKDTNNNAEFTTAACASGTSTPSWQAWTSTSSVTPPVTTGDGTCSWTNRGLIDWELLTFTESTLPLGGCPLVPETESGSSPPYSGYSGCVQNGSSYGEPGDVQPVVDLDPDVTAYCPAGNCIIYISQILFPSATNQVWNFNPAAFAGCSYAAMQLSSSACTDTSLLPAWSSINTGSPGPQLMTEGTTEECSGQYYTTGSCHNEGAFNRATHRFDLQISLGSQQLNEVANLYIPPSGFLASIPLAIQPDEWPGGCQPQVNCSSPSPVAITRPANAAVKTFGAVIPDVWQVTGCGSSTPLGPTSTITQLEVVNTSNTVQSAQFRCEATWPDGYAKWVLIDIQDPNFAEFTGGSSTGGFDTQYSLVQVASGGGNNPATQMATTSGGNVVVNTGAATFTISQSGQNLFDDVNIGGTHVVSSGNHGANDGLLLEGPAPSLVTGGTQDGVSCYPGPPNIASYLPPSTDTCTTFYNSNQDTVNGSCTILDNGPMKAVLECQSDLVNGSGGGGGTVLTASSCSASDIAAKWSSITGPGNFIIQVPSGACPYTTQLNLSNPPANTNITVQGAGSCTGVACNPGSGLAGNWLAASNFGDTATTCNSSVNTCITFNSGGSLNFGSGTNWSPTSFGTLSNITFIVNTTNGNGSVPIGGSISGPSYRLHHLHFIVNSGNQGYVIYPYLYGLVDHILVDDANTGTTAGPFACKGDTATSGEANWNEPTVLGSANELIVEDSVINQLSTGSPSTEGSYDAYNGCKITWRYNQTNGNTIGGGHGTDSGRERSPVIQEVYGDSINPGSHALGLMGPRGGIIDFYNNTVTGTAVSGITLKYYRISQLVGAEIGGWGEAGCTGCNWTPISSVPTNANSTLNTLNASPWASGTYGANAIVGPIHNNSGLNNYQNQSGSSCTTGGTEPNPWGQFAGGTGSAPTTTDGGCTWTNIGGQTTASDGGSGFPGFCKANPDTPSISNATCAALSAGDVATRYFDCSSGQTGCTGQYPFRDQPCVGHNQVVFGCYSGGNTLPGGLSAATLMSGDNANIQSGRDYFNNTLPGYPPYIYPSPLQTTPTIYMHQRVYYTFLQGHTDVQVSVALRNADYNTTETLAQNQVFNTAYKDFNLFDARITPNLASGTRSISIGNPTGVTTTSLTAGTGDAYVFMGYEKNFLWTDFNETGHEDCSSSNSEPELCTVSPIVRVECTASGVPIAACTGSSYPYNIYLEDGGQIQSTQGGFTPVTWTDSTCAPGWAEETDTAGSGIIIGIKDACGHWPNGLGFFSGGEEARIEMRPDQTQYLPYLISNTYSYVQPSAQYSIPMDLYFDFFTSATAPSSASDTFIEFQQPLMGRLPYYTYNAALPLPMVNDVGDDGYWQGVPPTSAGVSTQPRFVLAYGPSTITSGAGTVTIHASGIAGISNGLTAFFYGCSGGCTPTTLPISSFTTTTMTFAAATPSAATSVSVGCVPGTCLVDVGTAGNVNNQSGTACNGTNWGTGCASTLMWDFIYYFWGQGSTNQMDFAWSALTAWLDRGYTNSSGGQMQWVGSQPGKYQWAENFYRDQVAKGCVPRSDFGGWRTIVAVGSTTIDDVISSYYGYPDQFNPFNLGMRQFCDSDLSQDHYHLEGLPFYEFVTGDPWIYEQLQAQGMLDAVLNTNISYNNPAVLASPRAPCSVIRACSHWLSTNSNVTQFNGDIHNPPFYSGGALQTSALANLENVARYDFEAPVFSSGYSLPPYSVTQASGSTCVNFTGAAAISTCTSGQSVRGYIAMGVNARGGAENCGTGSGTPPCNNVSYQAVKSFMEQAAEEALYFFTSVEASYRNISGVPNPSWVATTQNVAYDGTSTNIPVPLSGAQIQQSILGTGYWSLYEDFVLGSAPTNTSPVYFIFPGTPTGTPNAPNSTPYCINADTDCSFTNDPGTFQGENHFHYFAICQETNSIFDLSGNSFQQKFEWYISRMGGGAINEWDAPEVQAVLNCILNHNPSNPNSYLLAPTVATLQDVPVSPTTCTGTCTISWTPPVGLTMVNGTYYRLTYSANPIQNWLQFYPNCLATYTEGQCPAESLMVSAPDSSGAWLVGPNPSTPLTPEYYTPWFASVPVNQTITGNSTSFTCPAGTCNIDLKAYAIPTVTIFPTNSLVCTGNPFATTVDGSPSSDSPCSLTLDNGTATSLAAVSPTIAVTLGGSSDFVITSNGCSSTLAAATTCPITITFSPTLVGLETAILTVTYTGGSVTYNLSGTGQASGVVSISPTTYNFGSVSIGMPTTSSAIAVTNNSGSTITGSQSQSGTNAGDFTNATGSGQCPSSIANTVTCNLYVTFNPTIVGSESATLNYTFTGASGSPVTVSLSGTGVSSAPIVSLNPTSLSFTVTLGNNQTLPVVLTNTGTATLTISSMVLSDTTDYAFTTIPASNCGGSVLAGNSCTINVEFEPATAGTLNKNLSITDNAAGSPQVIPLNGTSNLPTSTTTGLVRQVH